MKLFKYTLILTASLFIGLLAWAQETPRDLPPDVTFPVIELGNCQDRTGCGAYCDQSENARVCIDYAEAHNILPPEEIAEIRKILDIIETGGGPGSCTSEVECDAYCDNPDNMRECIIFAKEHDLIPADELQEVELVLRAIERGATPPRCHGRESCDEYCSQPDNLEECIAFAEIAGFMSSEEAEMVRKTGGKGPGNCRGKDECDAYCDNPDNMLECMEFGLQYGLIPPGEEKEMQMMLNALRQGIKPPPCRGEEECEDYCSQPENMMECVDFSEAAGFMSSEEAEQARRMAELGITGGPGECRNEEECEAYCSDPANAEECIMAGVESGDVSPEEAQRMIEDMRRGPEEMMGPGGMMGPEGEMMEPGMMLPDEMSPGGMMGPSSEEVEMMIREEEGRMRQEIMEQEMEQMQEIEGMPESFRQLERFLGQIITPFLIK